MVSTRVPMTPIGQATLKIELDQLKKVKRPKIIDAIVEAREKGDLKENAEYHAARGRQSVIEGRIKTVELKLANAQVIDVTKLSANKRVVFGCTVTLINIDNEEEVTYKIVGEDEARDDDDKISIQAPLARSLIKKEEGDEITLEALSGKIIYEIVEIQYK